MECGGGIVAGFLGLPRFVGLQLLRTIRPSIAQLVISWAVIALRDG